MVCSQIQRVLVLGLVVALIVGSMVDTKRHFLPNSLAHLTSDGSPYVVRAFGARVVVQNISSGGNNREIYWDRNAPESTAATICATWASGIGIARDGLAFRIAQRADGGYNAIVLTRNIWANIYWVFNATVFYTGLEYDTEAHPDGSPILKPYDGPEGVDLSRYLGISSRMTYPLRVCASIDEHDVLRFVVAKGSDILPPLDAPGNQGGQIALSIDKYYHSGQGRMGKHGIYAGHLPLGTSLLFDDITIETGYTDETS